MPCGTPILLAAQFVIPSSAGLTWLPFMNERYAAVSGGPVMKNGVPQPPLARGELTESIIGVGTFNADSRGRFPGRYRLAVLEELSRVSSRMRCTGRDQQCVE